MQDLLLHCCTGAFTEVKDLKTWSTTGNTQTVVVVSEKHDWRAS